MSNERYLGIAATVVAALLWSTGGLFIKLVSLSAFAILWYRSMFCSIAFLALFRKDVFRINKFSILAAVIYAPLLITFVTSTKLTTSANAIFLQYMAPAYVLLLEPLFFKTKLLKVNIVTLIACMAGMALFFVDGLSVPQNMLGIGLGVLSGFLLAAIIIVQKKNEPEFHASGVFWGNILVMILMTPMMLKEVAPTQNEWMMLAFLGIIQLGGGYAMFLFGQRHIPAIESALIAMLEPILNPVWVLIGYGEDPGRWAVIGGVVIISALVSRMLFLEYNKKKLSRLNLN